jgi:hypothetical protein
MIEAMMDAMTSGMLVWCGFGWVGLGFGLVLVWFWWWVVGGSYVDESREEVGLLF